MRGVYVGCHLLPLPKSGLSVNNHGNESSILPDYSHCWSHVGKAVLCSWGLPSVLATQ